MNKSTVTDRNPALDVTRTLAILAVIMIHICAPFIAESEIGSAGYIWGNIFGGLARIGVPLFLMTSGALMLREDKPISNKKLFGQKIPRLALLLAFWSALYAAAYYAVKPLIGGYDISLRVLIECFLTGHYHLWYLFMQIGLYLMLPFLRAFVKKSNKGLVLLYIGITLLVKFTVPILRSVSLQAPEAAWLIRVLELCELGFFSENIAYFLMGWFITQVGIPKKAARHGAYVLSALAIGISVFYVCLVKDYYSAYAHQNLLIFCYCTGVFLFVNSTCGDLKGGARRVFGFLSGMSFGMYVIHAAVLAVVEHFLPKAWTPPLYILTCFAAVTVLSLTATFVMSRIPLIRRAVKM